MQASCYAPQTTGQLSRSISHPACLTDERQFSRPQQVAGETETNSDRVEITGPNVVFDTIRRYPARSTRPFARDFNTLLPVRGRLLQVPAPVATRGPAIMPRTSSAWQELSLCCRNLSCQHFLGRPEEAVQSTQVTGINATRTQRPLYTGGCLRHIARLLAQRHTAILVLPHDSTSSVDQGC